MARDLKAKIRLEGDAKGADKAIKKTEGGLKRLTRSVRNFAKSSIFQFAATALALGGLVRGIRSAITAAGEQEAAERALQAARGASIEGLKQQAAALQKLTTFGDEAIIRAQTMIASFVKEEEAIKSATAATLDFASGVGMDLAGASALIAKTLGSTTNALTRYGIEVEGAVGSQERLNSLVENMAKVFGGRAAAEVDTFRGRVAQLSNAWGDVGEGIGFAITKNAGFNESMKEVTKVLSDNGKAIGDFTASALVGMIDAVKALIGYYTALGTAIGKVVAIFDRWNTDDVEVSQNALAATADRLGISVEELTKRIEANKTARRESTTAAKEGAEAETAAATAATASAEEQKKLAAALAESATAYEAAVAGASAFGEVTSVQLANKISEISLQLEVQKQILGEGSAEYERYASIGKAQIESLKERIDNLRQGLGDLKTGTKEASDGIGNFGTAATDAARGVDELARSNAGLAASFRDAGQAAQIGAGSISGPQGPLISGGGPGGGTFTRVRRTTQTPDGRIVFL